MSILVQRPSSIFNLLDEIDFPTLEWGNGRHQPSVDIRETDNSFILEADLPGLTEKNIDVEVDDSKLTIKAGIEEKGEKTKGKYLLRERRGLNFTRTFSLSPHADVANIAAEFENGILRITLPKKEHAQSKKVKVLTH